MEKQEWREYVHKVTTCDVPIPPNLINDYDDWTCRSNVGRMLLVLKDVEGAMAVLATVKDVQPDMEDAPEFGLSEAEHKVLCLRDIAQIVWDLTGTGDAPLYYLHEADRICHEYKHVFRSADRGGIWARRLEIMRACGKEEKALAEARALIAQNKDKEGINSYMFHALKFLAESEAAAGNYNKANLLLEEAYRYFPVTDAAERDIAEAKAQETPEERYASLLHCTTIQYQPWERDNVPTLEEVRRLQERNFALREAQKAAAEAAGETTVENTPDDFIKKFK